MQKLYGPVERNVQVYIIRPELDSVQAVINQLMQQNPADVEAAHILFVPRRTIECDELILENKEKIERYIKPRKWLVEDRIQNFAVDLVMLEEDLLSLELPDDFRHFMLADDDTYQVYVGNSINRIETVFGQIKHKYAKGNISSNIVERIQSQ